MMNSPKLRDSADPHQGPGNRLDTYSLDTARQIRRLERQIQALKFALRATIRILVAMRIGEPAKLKQIADSLETIQPSDQ